jgi:hypothetical protein
MPMPCAEPSCLRTLAGSRHGRLFGWPAGEVPVELSPDDLGVTIHWCRSATGFTADTARLA